MIFFKHRLRKKLPYYRLTRNAKRRMDEIAEALPPRETGVVDLTPPAEQEVNGPRHLKQEVPQPIQPVRERPAAVFLRVAVSALVCIAFVGLIATVLILRSAAPATLPAAASSELAPTAAPTPAPLYTMEIENAETRGGCAFFDVVLTFLEEEYRHAAFYTTSVNEPQDVTNTAFSIGGKTAKLDGSPIFYQEDLPSRYRATVSAKLPESYEGGSIDAELTISALYGMNFSGDRDVPITEPDFTIKENCIQSFTLTEATPWATVVGAANGVELNFVDYDWITGRFNVRIRYPDLDGFMPSLWIVDQDEEMLWPYFIGDKFSEGDGTASITFVYEGLTVDMERLQMRVWFSYFVEQTLDTMQVLAAEYTLFPQEDRFIRSEEYQDLGMAEFDMELITANWNRSELYYTDHVCVTDFWFTYAEAKPGYISPVLNADLDFDLPWALPLQAEIKLETGETIVIPLEKGKTEQERDEYQFVTFDVENYQRAGLPHLYYHIIVSLFDNSLFTEEYDAEILIRNRVSGRVLATAKADLRSHTDGVDDTQGSSETPADPEPSPEPPAASQQPSDQMPEDGQSSEVPPDDSQSSENKEPEQPAPPEGEATPAPDDET